MDSIAWKLTSLSPGANFIQSPQSSAHAIMTMEIQLLLVFTLAFSLCACSSSGKTETTTVPAIADAAPPATQEGEESAIEDIGKVEVEQKLLSVEITVPADFVGETTQADLDANVSAGKFLSAKLNDDGSVTYSMTKGQHKEVLRDRTLAERHRQQSPAVNQSHDLHSTGLCCNHRLEI